MNKEQATKILIRNGWKHLYSNTPNNKTLHHFELVKTNQNIILDTKELKAVAEVLRMQEQGNER